MHLIHIDGSQGEGGGQLLRTALALSLVTGQPFRIEKIRARRPQPGLSRQHLAAVEVAAAVGRARVIGGTLGSPTLTFTPDGVSPGEYHFDISSAGSATLVLQTILPALVLTGQRSVITIEGDTHNPLSPPFDFIAKTFMPLLNRMGARVSVELERPECYPAGGGRLKAIIEPHGEFRPLHLMERGPVRGTSARAMVAKLNRDVAERELAVIHDKLGWNGDTLQIEEHADSTSPGNVVLIEVESEHVTEIITTFGERGVPPEIVAGKAAADARRYLNAGVPVGEHLADQLLIPIALAGEGSFATLTMADHVSTNLEVIHWFLNIIVTSEPIGADAWALSLQRR